MISSTGGPGSTIAWSLGHFMTCHNDSGFLFWSMCNSSSSERNACYDDYKCYSFDHLEGLYVVIELEGAKPDDLDLNEFKRTVHDMTRDDASFFYTEINDEGDLLALFIYRGDEYSAKIVSKALKKVDPEGRSDILKFKKEVSLRRYPEVHVSCAISLQEMMKVMMLIIFIYMFAGTM